MIHIQAIEDKCIKLGRRGENSARTVHFDISEWVKLYGSGDVLLVAKRQGDLNPYSVTITRVDNEVSWVIAFVDVDSPGYGECELVYIVDGRVAKSTIYQTYTEDSLSDPVLVPESPSTYGSTNMKIGNLDKLSTENKKSLVEALNEVNQKLSGDSDLEIGVGRATTGKIFEPYTVDEGNNYAYIYGDPIEAADGAEIFNDYDNNLAVGAWSSASGCKTQAVGNYSKAEGWWTRADGQCAVASGLLSIASGHFAHAEGTRTVSAINNAHSEGDMTQATGRQSHSEGQKTVSSGFCSHAEGSATTSSGYYSHAEGWGTIAKGKNQTAMGKYNIADTTNLLIVGKGSKDTARSNALTLNSSGNLWVAGTVTSEGADYAEFFEWSDGNPNAEDRVGLAVTLEGDKIRLANADDDIIGIISGTAMVLGDNYEHEWRQKYLTDDYGRVIYDEPVEEFIEYTDYVDPDDESTWVTVKESTGFHVYPKLNPQYNPNEKYISRTERKEWDAVGLIGKLHANDDSTCVVGGYAKVKANGVLTHSSEKTNMRVLKRITDSIVLVLKL